MYIVFTVRLCSRLGPALKRKKKKKKNLVRIFTGRILDSQGSRIQSSLVRATTADETAMVCKLIWVSAGRIFQKATFSFFFFFFRYVLTSEEDVRRGSVNECKRGLAENKRGAQLRKRIYRCETRVSIVKR